MNERANRLKMRLAIARQAIADLQDESKIKTEAERLELMKLVERLTSGKPAKTGPRRKKHTVFD